MKLHTLPNADFLKETRIPSSDLVVKSQLFNAVVFVSIITEYGEQE